MQILGIRYRSRNAILTGLYPYHTGLQVTILMLFCIKEFLTRPFTLTCLQHYVITMKQNASVPLNVKLLPEYLRHAGYATHMVGKYIALHC